LSGIPQPGEFVRIRSRRWLVEDGPAVAGLNAVRLACIDDDAQGDAVSVLWDAELDAEVLVDEGWANVSKLGTDDPSVFSAYLRTLRWNTATAADRNLFQAPFRAGIHQDAYQLLPLQKALRLPRVNLLIADDVGAGKTVEAGLIVRELLLRRRIDFVLVAAPAGMVRQWQDELEAKFGLTFTIIDREYLNVLRRERGYGASPWAAGSRFLISHSLMSDETYVGGLRDLLQDFRARTLLILDEAHHAAPASGSRYAVDSQFTRAIRGLADRFEHRLFLTATPHNGHSNSFSALLEILDPQRFTSGVPVKPPELEPVMVRRLKSDLRFFGVRFPERKVEAFVIKDLPKDAPELQLSRMLLNYGEALRAKTADIGAREAGLVRLSFVGLQQRLLSSVAAFAKTLEVHRKGLVKANAGTAPALAEAFVQGGAEPEDETDDPADGAAFIATEETEAAEAAGALAASVTNLALVDEMLALARRHAQDPDARVRLLAPWIRRHMTADGRWNQRRLVLFTEYEDTRRWLEVQLAEALDDLRPDDRIASFTGATSTERREDLKRRFNSNPAEDPLRILICTDAAREGINLQMRCHDLIHIDLPWNPARLEQRNGRIDRKLQPSPEVWCRYFVYEQRPEDVVLQALVRKTERIREQLGSAGRVIGQRLSERLTREGIWRPETQAREIDQASDERLEKTAVAEMDEGTAARRAQQAKDLDKLRALREESRERVGVEPEMLEKVVSEAMARAGASLEAARSGEVNGVALFRFDPDSPAFVGRGWAEALDDLRIRRRKRSERLKDWRADAPLRAVSFRPALTADGIDVEGVLQLHLEHRLVRRLLSRFLSKGFVSGLSRASIVIGPGAQPRVVLLGRLALYGPGAARLHEEILLVTASWTESRSGPMKPFGAVREAATLEQLDHAFREPRTPAQSIIDRIRPWAERDANDLEPELLRRAEARKADAIRDLSTIGDAEAKAIRRLLEDQRARVAKADAEPEDMQLNLFDDAEAEQRRRDRRRWKGKLEKLTKEIAEEPDRVRAGYDVVADRLETIGLVYLWPEGN
jgi:superfamily II DNA or RNA helicase